MTTTTEDHGPHVDPAMLEQITAGLLRNGWVVIEQAVSSALITGLRADLERLDDTAFDNAGVGRADQWRQADTVRRDRIYWLDANSDSTRSYFDWIESLRIGLNQGLLLGLFDYECHFAWYGPGAFYTNHVDAFRGDDNRKVSTVLYLNADWQPTDGGELVLCEAIDDEFDPSQPARVAAVVAPTGGTLVCFLSEEIPHEVLDARADRYSIAGWFRVNGNSRRLDPPVYPLI